MPGAIGMWQVAVSVTGNCTDPKTLTASELIYIRFVSFGLERKYMSKFNLLKFNWGYNHALSL